MKALVKDVREVSTKHNGLCVRFSVTFLADDGEPEFTQQGFLMDRFRRVRAPVVPLGRSVYQWTQISERFAEQLKNALNGMASVQEILGPELPPLRTSDEEATL